MKIVFFGDSITDCGRDRSDDKSLGGGYVKMLCDKLRPIYPDTEIEIYNKGIAGDEVCDLLARADKDVISLNPDAVVIMIGINNAVHKFKYGKELDLKEFERDYSRLIGMLKETGATVIVLEPFLMPAPDKLRMRKLFDAELAVIHKIATDIADEFVAFDEMFNGLSQSIPYTEFSLDGIHPTFRGSQLIADTAIKAIRKHLL